MSRIKPLLLKRSSFTIPEVQSETGEDYGSIKKCVDELVSEQVFSQPEGLTYFRLRESPRKKKSAPSPFRSLFDDDDDDDGEEEVEIYRYCDVPRDEFFKLAAWKMRPYDSYEKDGKLIIGVDDVLPDDEKLNVFLELSDGKYVFSDGCETYVRAAAAGNALSFRFFANRLSDGGEFGGVRVSHLTKAVTVQIDDADKCALYIAQLTAAVRSFFGRIN